MNGDRSDLAAALLIERMVRDAYPDRTPGAISALQWSILRGLARTEPQEKTPSWLAGFVGVTAAPISRALQSLERRGLIRTLRSASDARQTVVRLTENGESALANDPIRAISRRIGRLPEADRVAFKELLRKLMLDNREGGGSDA